MTPRERQQRFGFLRHARGDCEAAQGVPAQMAAQAPRGRGQPGGGRRAALHLYPAAADPVAQRAHHQRDRAAARGIQATDQQTVLPSAETAAMLFWALLASGQITMRKVDGWQTLANPLDQPIDLAA